MVVGTAARLLAQQLQKRLPLLLADMAALQPDVIGLQEVVYTLQQDRLLGAAGVNYLMGVPGSELVMMS